MIPKLFCLLLSGLCLAECFPMTTLPKMDDRQKYGTKGIRKPVLPTPIRVPTSVVASPVPVNDPVAEIVKVLDQMADAAMLELNVVEEKRPESARPSPSIHPDIILTDASKDPPSLPTTQDPLLNLGTVEGTPLFATAHDPPSQPLLNDDYFDQLFGDILTDDTMNADLAAKHEARINEPIVFRQSLPTLPLQTLLDVSHESGLGFDAHEELYQIALTKMKQLSQELYQLEQLHAIKKRELERWFVVKENLLVSSKPPSKPRSTQAGRRIHKPTGLSVSSAGSNMGSRSSKKGQRGVSSKPRHKMPSASTTSGFSSTSRPGSISSFSSTSQPAANSVSTANVATHPAHSFTSANTASHPSNSATSGPASSAPPIVQLYPKPSSKQPILSTTLPSDQSKGYWSMFPPVESSSSSSATSLKKDAEKKSETSSSKRTRKATSRASVASKKSKSTSKE